MWLVCQPDIPVGGERELLGFSMFSPEDEAVEDSLKASRARRHLLCDIVAENDMANANLSILLQLCLCVVSDILSAPYRSYRGFHPSTLPPRGAGFT